MSSRPKEPNIKNLQLYIIYANLNQTPNTNGAKIHLTSGQKESNFMAKWAQFQNPTLHLDRISGKPHNKQHWYQAASALAVRWCMDINLFALKGCKRAALVLRCNHQLILSLFSFHWWICSSVCSVLCPLWTTITIHLNSWKGGISKTTFVCLKVGHSFFRKPELIFKRALGMARV